MITKGIQIASDSVCDLPAAIVEKFAINIIPTYVNIGEESIADDGLALNRERFYQDLPRMRDLPTTAAPSPGDAEAFFRKILSHEDQRVISIHVPARLSGVLNAMRLGADAVSADRVTLVDSQQLTLGMGFQVWVAAELAASGAGLKTILATIERVRQHTRVYAIIDTLEYLRRSGRVNVLLANFGSLLKIKPIIEVRDGDIKSLARMRTWARATARLGELARAQAPLDRLAVLHINNQSAAEGFLDTLSDIAPPDSMIVEVTPTLGTHIGPGSIGVATLNEKWRQ